MNWRDHSETCETCGFERGGMEQMSCLCSGNTVQMFTGPSTDRDALAAEVVRLRELVKRWKALGKRHDIGLREAECVCTWEQGDSQCPAHPTCDECGCVACECKPTGALAELAR